jgi:putative FmdB family regulatory protein
MPLYDRRCGKCEALWEISCKISEKDHDHECPECGSVDGEWMMSAPNVSMQSGRFGNTTDKKSGFHEVVSKIAKTYPRSELAKRV